MNDKPASRLPDNFHALQQTYLKRLGGHIADFKRYEELLLQGLLPLQDIQQLYRLTHNFSGSGATFGFPQISRSALALHNSVKAFLDSAADQHTITQAKADTLEKLQTFVEICKDTIQKQLQIPAPTVSTAVNTAQENLSDTKTIVMLAATPAHTEELISQLKYFGYNLVLFSNADALAHYNEIKPYAILVYNDLSMLDTVRLQTMHNNKHLKVNLPLIFVTEHDDFDTRVAAVRMGAEGFFHIESDTLKIIDKIEQLAIKNLVAPAYRILIVDDDDMLAEFYGHALSHAGMITLRLANPKHILKTLAGTPIDLVLIDFNMPHYNGQELAAVIRQHDQYVSLPIVFMSAREEVEAKLVDSGLGIDDFLTKPFTPEQLVSVITSRAKRSAELQALMIRDSFTGLLNHAYFLERLATECEQSKRYNYQSSYAIIDIDKFKNINDTYGHSTGDVVIKTLARMLQQRLRRFDIIGRCGGEEFGIILPKCDLENAKTIIESLRVAFSETQHKAGKKRLNASFSAGITLINSEVSIDQVINVSDQALYMAKEQGRNRIITR